MPKICRKCICSSRNVFQILQNVFEVFVENYNNNNYNAYGGLIVKDEN